MIGEPVLLEVVGPDLLAPVAALDLSASGVADQCSLLLLTHLEQPGTKHLHGARPVLQLAALVLHGNDDPCGPVCDAHGGVGGVDALPAGARGPVHVDLQVVRVDIDIELLRLGQHTHGRCGGVNTPLALGDGHALHAVRATLELEVGPRIVALQHERDLVDPPEVRQVGAEHLHGPSLARGIGLIHVEQVAGEQVRLLATLGATHFHDQVLAVVRVARQQEQFQLGLERLEIRLGRGQFLA